MSRHIRSGVSSFCTFFIRIIISFIIPDNKWYVRLVQVGPGTVYLRFKGFGGEGVLFFNVTPLEPLLMKITHTFYSSRSMLHPFGLLILLGEAIQVCDNYI